MPDIKNCIEEIIQVCNRHGVVLSHEDSQGAFFFLEKSGLEGQKHFRTGETMIEVYHGWLRHAELRED